MPREVFGANFAFTSRPDLLTFDELERFVRLAATLGVQKVRLTGGEPLLRPHVEDLVARLARIPGIADIAMTTNGALLEKYASRLARAGLHRVTISLDAIDDTVFRAMADTDISVSQVLGGIVAARRARLYPIKINVVVKAGVNENQIIPIVERFRWTGCIVRFIEYMDVGETNNWRLQDVVPATAILATIAGAYAIEPLPRRSLSDTAMRYRLSDGSLEIGQIASITQPFCGSCTRLRLSADGEVYTCLFASKGTSVRAALRGGASDIEILELLRQLWIVRDDRYSELRTVRERSNPLLDDHRIEMSRIGG